MSGAGGGLAGTGPNGSFFEAPSWVDVSKRPGATPQAAPAWMDWLKGVLQLKHIFFSPNLVWLSCAVFIYVAFPYDFEEARTFQLGWVARRVLINFAGIFAYTGFWHCALYLWHWSERKFVANRPSGWRVAHNIWYSCLGTLQWSAWEVIFMHMYATKKLPYLADEEAFATKENAARMVFWTAAIPLFRGVHFYFAHRFIHIKVIYKYVHSLHHRNIDIEPFAGLCMHPIEHLYYLSCVAPALYFYASPFHFLFNGVHLMLSPAASHSGWEDHMQSDQFHYLHHRRFECNYGSASFPLDKLFGTFREVMYGESKIYCGEGGKLSGVASDLAGAGGASTDSQKKSAAAKKDASAAPVIAEIKSNVPAGFYVYMAYTLLTFTVAAVAVFTPHLAPPGLQLQARPYQVAGFVAFGPIVFAALLMKATGDKADMRWPFHRDGVPKFGLHTVGGFLLAVLPVYHTLTTLLATGPYCQLWGFGESMVGACVRTA